MRAALVVALLSFASFAPSGGAAVAAVAPEIVAEIAPTIHSYAAPLEVAVTISEIAAAGTAPAPGTSIVLRLPAHATSAAPPEPSAGWQRVSDYILSDDRLQVEYAPAIAAPATTLSLAVALDAFGSSACGAQNTWEIEARVLGASALRVIPIVCDRAAPVIAPFDDIILEAAGPEGAIAAYAPVATDDLDAAPVVTCAPESGAAFALGEHDVACGATDAAGNAAEPISFTITVRDTTAPTIEAALDRVAEATSAAGASVLYDAPATHDLVDLDGVATCLPAAGVFALGATLVTCGATDAAGNPAATVSFTVTVADTTAPAIDAMPDLVVEATGADGAEVSFDAPATLDAVDGAGVATCDAAPGIFPLGTTAIECSAVDAAANAAQVSFTVAVLDASAPVIDAAPDVTLEATGSDGAAAAYDAPASRDVVDGVGVASCSPAAGTVLALGAHVVTCDAEDASGNAAAPVAFTIAIVDSTAPAIAQPDDINVTATSSDGAYVAIDPPAWSDAVDGSGVSSCDAASGTFAIGTHVVTCSALDAAANGASVVFSVHVAPRPAMLTLGVIVAPANTGVAEVITLSIPVANGGDLAGSGTLALVADGVALAGVSIAVPAGGSITHSATFASDVPGVHVLRFALGGVESAPVELLVSAPVIDEGNETDGEDGNETDDGGNDTDGDDGNVSDGDDGNETDGGDGDGEDDGADDEPAARRSSGTPWMVVRAESGGPSARMDAPASAEVGEPVALVADASGDATFTWMFDDGASDTGARVTHAWTRAGTYTITLLTRIDGQTVVTSSTIEVRAPAPAPEESDEASGPGLDGQTGEQEAATEPPTVAARVAEGILRSPASVTFDAPADAFVFWRAVGVAGWTEGRVAEVAGDGAIELEYYALLGGVASETQRVTLQVDGLEPTVTSAAAEGRIGGARIEAAIDDVHIARVAAVLTGTRGEGQFTVPMQRTDAGYAADASGLPPGEYDVVVKATDVLGQVSSHAIDGAILVTASEAIEGSSVEGASAGVPGPGLAGALVCLALAAFAARRRRA